MIIFVFFLSSTTRRFIRAASAGQIANCHNARRQLDKRSTQLPMNLIGHRFVLTEIFVRQCRINITKQNKQYIDTNTFITQVVVICTTESHSTLKLDQSEQSCTTLSDTPIGDKACLYGKGKNIKIHIIPAHIKSNTSTF